MNRRLHIALVASQGGHSGQMKIIADEAALAGRYRIFITEKQDIKEIGKSEKKFKSSYPLYLFRKDYLKWYPWRYVSAFFHLCSIYRAEEIDVLITNGAQLSIPAVVAAKMLNIKVIFIETFIRVKSPTLTGRFCYFFSDIFLVQHPAIARKYGSRAHWKGSVL